MLRALLFLLQLFIFVFVLSSGLQLFAEKPLYTEGRGKNPPFEEIRNIISNNKGYPGTEIRVNNRAVEGGIFSDYGIQKNLRVHALGNPSVSQSKQSNWTRWYQTDGSTQVFRLFAGEESVRKGVKLRARVEAFNSKVGWNFDDGEWHEWVGRYTIVEPMGAAIFQIKDLNDDWALQLNMNQKGKVSIQHRRPLPGQEKRKTLFENAVGKPFDVRIRDNGRDYEVYLGDQKSPFSTGRFLRNTKPDDNTNTRFRWGLYVGANQVHNDGMIFVSHATVDPK